MIIIINKLQIRGKRFCEKRVRGSNLGVKCGQMPSPRPSPTGLRVPQKNEKHDEV